ncbi:MAG: hypothetical protein ACRDT0_22940 [Pseudonocardiaceae bacterium]
MNGAARPSPGEQPRHDRCRQEEALQAARDGSDESAWSWVGEADDERARAHGDKLDRLAADVDLHTRLALIGFTGPDYEEFQTELTRYGLDVMTGWLRTGKVFTKMREANYGLPPPADGGAGPRYPGRTGWGDRSQSAAPLPPRHPAPRPVGSA